MKYFNAKPAALALAGSLATAGLAEENVMVVFDGSNSMWGQIDGVAKIEIARDVMQNLLGEWSEDRKVGLMAYGHRRRGDCSDIETLVTPSKSAREEILSRINSITPTGKTPLTDAIEQAAIALSYTDQPATVVLISDGLESCGRDPCALAAEL
ncbi:von Willebrand factor type A domain protein, partial [hydrothermal vent metagenome]